jgi:hypothetical protein
MRKLYILLFLNLHLILLAQPVNDARRDYTWIMGVNYRLFNVTDHVLLNFHQDDLNLTYQKTPNGHSFYQSNGSVCDKDGKLLFYSNGCVLVDGNHKYIDGADTINKGQFWPSFCSSSQFTGTLGHNIPNGCQILPVSENKFKVFYTYNEDAFSENLGIKFTSVYELKMGGLRGGIVDKFATNFECNPTSYMSVRHANGRDWWLLNQERSSSIFHATLIDSSDQNSVDIVSDLDSLPNPGYWGAAQSCFSPDGTVFAQIGLESRCRVYDFDRCSAELSNPRIITPPYADSNVIVGVAVSPNSRFMYLMSYDKITQYDLLAPDLQGSEILVAQKDTFRQGTYHEPSFYMSQLGPDGKIYIFSPASRNSIAVIDKPDVQGIGCNVVQHKYYFPQWGPVAQPPRFPNFRLGPVVGSPCDTLTVSTFAPEPVKAQMVLRPNPATSHAVADISVSDYSADMQLSLTVTDLSGSEVAQYSVPPYAALQRIETEYLPNGVYFVALKSRGRLLRTEKLVVLRE